MRKTSGHTVQSIYSVLVIGTFAANLMCYLGVWIAVVSSEQNIKVDFNYQNKNFLEYTPYIIVRQQNKDVNWFQLSKQLPSSMPCIIAALLLGFYFDNPALTVKVFLYSEWMPDTLFFQQQRMTLESFTLYIWPIIQTQRTLVTTLVNNDHCEVILFIKCFAMIKMMDELS